jgi:hypothetical protein
MREAKSQSTPQLRSIKVSFNQILCARFEINTLDSLKSLETYEFFLKTLLSHRLAVFGLKAAKIYADQSSDQRTDQKAGSSHYELIPVLG